jgi:sigma-E factor negative regulatory protein RseA
MSEIPVKQELQEALSALVDGEVTELELRRLLKASDEQYAALRETWLSHQTASASIKKDVPTIDFRDLSNSISAAIADEPVLSQSSKTAKKQSVWSGVGRFAIAASVAGAVVLGVQFAPSDINPQVADVQVPVQSSVPSSFERGIPSNTAVSTVSNESGVGHSAQQQQETIIINENTQQKLQQAEEQVNRLMLEHAQNAAQNTQQGVLPYTRVPESIDKP